MFGFDWIEKTILGFVFATNTLWLPIFMYQLWEIKHLIDVLEEYDQFGILENNNISIKKVSLEEQNEA